MYKIRYLIILFCLMGHLAYTQSNRVQADAVLAMPQGLPKLNATIELFQQYNADPVKSDQLFKDGLSFTVKPALAAERAKLLVANASRLFNNGESDEVRKYLFIAITHIKIHSVKDPAIFAKIGSLYALLGEEDSAKEYFNQDKTRGKETIATKLHLAEAYNAAGNKTAAINAISDAEDEFNFDNPETSETGHILCQLIIQSVRLKRFKELDKYYSQLKLQTSYNTAFEYILARGLYFEYKKNLKGANTDYESLADAYAKGKQNEQTLEGVIRLGALLSAQRFETAAIRYFDFAKKGLTKNLMIQPIGKIYTTLRQEHQIRYNGMSDLDALMAKVPTLDSAYTNEVIRGLQYQLSVNIKQNKIDSLQQAKIVQDLRISKEKQTYWLITLSLILMLSIAFLVIYVFYQRRKRTILLFKAEKERTENLHKQELSRMLANAQEQERSKIAEKLHDEIGSMLAVVRLNLSVSDDANGNLSGSQINTANKVLNDVAATVREMSHELMPVLIQKMGLKKAVEQLVEDINTAGKLQIESVIIGIDEDVEELNYEFKVNIYRIIQELFHNILKHAKATAVTFQLIRHPSEINILVEDNGVGMDKGKDAEGKGMKLIAARVNSYQGKVVIESNADAGTIVIIELPFQKQINQTLN